MENLLEIPAPPAVKSAGELAYERELAKRPTYADGSPRPQWDALREIAQWSWNRNPTDRA